MGYKDLKIMKLITLVCSLLTFVLLVVAAVNETITVEWKSHQQAYKKELLSRAATEQNKEIAREIEIKLRQVYLPALNRSDRCVTCHIGENDSHTFEAVEASCLECHDEDLDTGGLQDEVAGLIDQLGDLLVAEGMLSGDEEHGYHPVVGTYPAAKASALWNYILIAIEDGYNASQGPQRIPVSDYEDIYLTDEGETWYVSEQPDGECHRRDGR